MTCYIGYKKADNFRTPVFSIAYLLFMLNPLCLRLPSFVACLLFIPCLRNLRLSFSVACLIYLYIVSLNQRYLHQVKS